MQGMNPFFIPWKYAEALAWEQRYYVERSQVTLGDLLVQLSVTMGLLFLVACFLLQTAKLIHIISYRPRRGDITMRLGTATLHS